MVNTHLLSDRRLPAKQALRRGGKLGQSEKFLERLGRAEGSAQFRSGPPGSGSCLHQDQEAFLEEEAGETRRPEPTR